MIPASTSEFRNIASLTHVLNVNQLNQGSSSRLQQGEKFTFGLLRGNPLYIPDMEPNARDSYCAWEVLHQVCAGLMGWSCSVQNVRTFEWVLYDMDRYLG